MVCEGRQMRPAKDVFDEDTQMALFAALLRKAVSGELQQGNFRLESDNPAINGMTLIVPSEVAAA